MRQQTQQQKKLKALISELERDLSEGKSQIAALEETQERLRESERICQELAEENRRLGEEITGWRKGLAKSDEDQRQLSILRQQLEALQAEHARFLDSNLQIQDKLTASGEPDRVSSAVVNDSVRATDHQGKSTIAETVGSNLFDSNEPGARTRSNKEGASVQIRGTIVRHWRMGATFACLLVVVIVGVVMIKRILIAEGRPSRDTIVFMPESTGGKPPTDALSKPMVKTASRISGVFQTVRATQVFTGPTEESEFVANISKGTKVNVVDSKDGWLEIRSKHGRPPGFIRQEATVRIN